MLNLTAQEWSWVLYDVGNSAFILLVTAIVPIYFHFLTDEAGLTESQYMSYWGYAISCATVVVALLGPICGTLADHRGFKKPMFVCCMLLGAAGCADIITQQRGRLGIVPEAIRCDYYDWCDGKRMANSYRGEYMMQYSWGEYTNAVLCRTM